MSSFGDRLREERERLRLSQTDFAEKVGATRKTQFNYETDQRRPDADYLMTAMGLGVDVLFLLTGSRTFDPPQALAPDEQVVLEGYRQLDPRGKAGVMGLIGGMSPDKGASLVFHGAVGHVIKAEQPFSTTTKTINVGKTSKSKK